MTKLYGLILAGGKSTRMGSDKGLLNYHGEPQRDYLYRAAATVCDQVFYSARQDQEASFNASAPLIIDQNKYRGPFNGILSAHQAHPEVAWLVLACDLPLIDADGLAALVAARDPQKAATAFASKDTHLPEPLIAIWEPQGLTEAMTYLETAQSSCPRKYLINAATVLVKPPKEEYLYNANSLEDYQLAKKKLS